MNGLDSVTYFASLIIVFFILGMFVTVLQLSMVFIFSIEAYTNGYAFTMLFILLALFIPSSLLFSAVFSYAFNTLEAAETVYSQLASWSGTMVGIVVREK